MPVTMFTQTMRRFIHDQHASLAMVPARWESTCHARRHDEESPFPALLTAGLIAGLYIAVRIGLAYALLGH